jgi:hypothetical protein
MSPWKGNKGLFSINFKYLVDKDVQQAAVRRLAERLVAIPEFKARIAEPRKADYGRMLPSIPIDPVLGRPGAVETIVEALDELLGTRARAQ